MQDVATLLAGGYGSAGLTQLKIGEKLNGLGSHRETGSVAGVVDGGGKAGNASSEDSSSIGRQVFASIFSLGLTLELLDLSGTGIGALPGDLATGLPQLRIAFFSRCGFVEFPAAALAGCARLEMVAFRSNGMRQVGSEAFEAGEGTSAATALARSLRWLILTDNRLEVLPASIGRCGRLEKCMLAGNCLTVLPDAMAACGQLTLLRLAANRLAVLPPWLWQMPRLAFLSYAGNPCTATETETGSLVATTTTATTPAASDLPRIAWRDIDIHHELGQGASGVVLKGVVAGGPVQGTDSGYSSTLAPASSASSFRSFDPSAAEPSTAPSCAAESLPGLPGLPPHREVAIKVFRGALTSDGTPYDEMAACMAAGQHVNLVRIHGQVRFAVEAGDDVNDDHDNNEETNESNGPEGWDGSGTKAFKGGLVMELIPPRYRVLGKPPSFATCTRDCFFDDEEENTGSGATAAASASSSLRLPTPADALAMLAGVASAAEHLHARGISHGDLYAHNVLVAYASDSDSSNGHATHAILSDFGAATRYGGGSDGGSGSGGGGGGGGNPFLEKLEVLAFAHLVEDVVGLVRRRHERDPGQAHSGTASRGNAVQVPSTVVESLMALHRQCSVPVVAERPTFASIVQTLAAIAAEHGVQQV